MYSWWHDVVLKVARDFTIAQFEVANQQPVTAREHKIRFHWETERPVKKNQTTPTMKRLNGTSDKILWHPYNFQQTHHSNWHCNVVRLKEECLLDRINNHTRREQRKYVRAKKITDMSRCMLPGIKLDLVEIEINKTKEKKKKKRKKHVILPHSVCNLSLDVSNRYTNVSLTAKSKHVKKSQITL